MASIQGPFQRILLKISGESFGSNTPFEMKSIHTIAKEIRQVHNSGQEIGIVVGGGNIIRGAKSHAYGLSRTTGDYMGMLGTVINALAFQDVLKSLGVKARVMTSRNIEGIGESYHPQRCLYHLSKGRIVIFAGGTGSPYFSTDTAAALKAVEINAQVFFKATKVDGVYDSDPGAQSNAQLFESLDYQKMLLEGYQVMDKTAVAFCSEHNMPILIFNFTKNGNLVKAASGEKVGTLVADISS